MNVICPYCEVELEVHEAEIDDIATCGSCDQDFRIGDVSENISAEEMDDFVKDVLENGKLNKIPPVIGAETSSNETVYLKSEGVTVTNKRVILTERTYAIKQITSVGISHDFNGPKVPSLVFGKPTEIFCFVPAVLCVLFLMWGASSDYPILLTIGTFLLIPTAVFGFRLIADSGQRYARYWVEIATASGREQAMQCVDEHSAQKVCAAINEALIDN